MVWKSHGPLQRSIQQSLNHLPLSPNRHLHRPRVPFRFWPDLDHFVFGSCLGVERTPLRSSPLRLTHERERERVSLNSWTFRIPKKDHSMVTTLPARRARRSRPRATAGTPLCPPKAVRRPRPRAVWRHSARRPSAGPPGSVRRCRPPRGSGCTCTAAPAGACTLNKYVFGTHARTRPRVVFRSRWGSLSLAARQRRAVTREISALQNIREVVRSSSHGDDSG